MSPYTEPVETTSLLLSITRSDVDSVDESNSTRGTSLYDHDLYNPSIRESSGTTSSESAYPEYGTIDWFRELVDGSSKFRSIQTAPGIRGRLYARWNASQGWVAAAATGALTAGIVSVVDIGVAVVAGWREGYCRRSIFIARERCCRPRDATCAEWHPWAESYRWSYTAYVLIALALGILACTITLTSKKSFSSISKHHQKSLKLNKQSGISSEKTLYMAAGSGIPEIKTILSGFAIPHFFSFRVMLTKATACIFTVATGMALGKEGPCVHISACAGHLIGTFFPKYQRNQAKMRELLSVACSAGLSVAFGAPIGGVLFSYEEMSTYFPRPVLWKAFLCSLCASTVLKELNPRGTGKLIVFETNFTDTYQVEHYAFSVLLGICGGIFGGVFCLANFRWAKTFRRLRLIQRHPILEVVLVVLATAVLQYPNRLLRTTGDITVAEMFTDCNPPRGDSWVCQQEKAERKAAYYGLLVSGTVVKLFLMIITFGCKVPSGTIIPALSAGALFGRWVGLLLGDISPGILAMVGAASFLAGVSRMTVSLAVIMLEVTGDLNYVLPMMVAILTSKWVAEAISPAGIYDLSQQLAGHPFFDSETAMSALAKIRHGDLTTMRELVPSAEVMQAIVVRIEKHCPTLDVLNKVARLKIQASMDWGLVLENEHGILQGYLPGYSVQDALVAETSDNEDEDGVEEPDVEVRLMQAHLDRTPLTVSVNAPLEYGVEMFGKLGLGYLLITDDDSGTVVGVVTKRSIVTYLDGLRQLATPGT